MLVDAIYVLLLGVATLSPSLTRSAFGYEVRDPGVLLVLSSAFLGLGVLLWAIAANSERFGGLASAVVVALVVGAVFLIWGWMRGLYTARNALVPLIINIVLAGWIWSARPRS